MRTSEVFSHIKSKDLLLSIAGKRHIDVEEHNKNLGKAIADDAHNTGIKKFVEILPADLLDSLGVETKSDDGGHKLHRSVARKRVIQKMQEDTPQKFFDKLDSKVLASLVDAAFDDDDEKPSSKKHAEGLITKIDEFGLENALSTLSLPELADLAHALKLKVSSNTSSNAFITAIMTGKDQKTEKKKAEVQTPSKTKPKIAKGISKIDLQHHFYREELVTYCKENGLSHSGHKSALINHITNHLEGKKPAAAASKKRKAPSGGKSEKPAKKAKAEHSEKEDKSEKSEGKEDKEEAEKPKKGKKNQ